MTGPQYASSLLRNSPVIPIVQAASFSLTAPLHRTSLSAPSHHPPLFFSHDITILPSPCHTMLADASGRRDAFCSQLPRSRLPDRVGELFASNARNVRVALLISSRCSYCAANLGDRAFSIEISRSPKSRRDLGSFFFFFSSYFFFSLSGNHQRTQHSAVFAPANTWIFRLNGHRTEESPPTFHTTRRSRGSADTESIFPRGRGKRGGEGPGKCSSWIR